VQTLNFSPVLADVTAKVLESMFFTGIQGEAAASAGQGCSWIAAALAFEGNPSGKFGIGVSPESARSLAANFLGLDAEELAQMQMDEVIGELANMIAGSFVSRLESDCCFALSHPELQSSDEFAERLGAADSYIFELEDGLLAVWLDINS
jgi:CheY-specific phosphatase CheX